jgi:hypothetical protein
MGTASIVRPSKVFQHDLFSRLVLHKINPEKQSPEERKAARAEIDHLSLQMPVREVHTHGNLLLDALDVHRHLSEVLNDLNPSADPAHRTRSLVEVLDKVFMLRLETDDLIEVLVKKLEDAGCNWRELPCMQEPLAPTVTAIH